jgi:transposase
MLVVDGQGLPLAAQLASAQVAESRLALPTLDQVRVAQPRGRPKQRPGWLVADRGYDSRPLRQRGMRVCIPAKRRPAEWRPRRGRPIVADPGRYRQRWIIERTFAWLGNYRRLLGRWERLLVVYHGFFTVAFLLLCLNRLLK